MACVVRSQLLPGVFLTSVHTQKFKSSLLSMTLLAPLEAGTATANALLPYLLRRGSQAHPDLSSISAALDRLYGGSIEPMVRKKGEIQCVGFVGSFLDDAYTLDGSEVLNGAAELMGEILLRPYTQDGAFCPDYTRQEKGNLIDRIRAEVNDKRQYASNRVIEEMCHDEPYGVGRLGRDKDVEALTPQTLWTRYQELLGHSCLELYYCGSAEHDKVCVILQRVLSGLPREGGYQVPETIVPASAVAPRQVEETLDVAQGKLTMGFRTGGVTAASSEYPALTLCNALYGGTTTSKLFLNVREKLSLCYYAGSTLHRYKGIMLVSSGVEFANKGRAEDEIMAQLEACRRGEFEPWEIEGARRYTVSSLLTILDNQGRQEDWWLGQSVFGLSEGPDGLAQRLEEVSVDAAIEAAKSLSLDTVYFLKGTEA